MKLKAIDILNIYHSLEKMSDLELDLSPACTIAKNLKELAVAKEVIENKRNKLITEYAKKNEDGTICQSENGSIEIQHPETFSAKLDELLSSETETNLIKIQKQTLSEIKVSPKTLLPLMTIMED